MAGLLYPGIRQTSSTVSSISGTPVDMPDVVPAPKPEQQLLVTGRAIPKTTTKLDPTRVFPARSPKPAKKRTGAWTAPKARNCRGR